MEKIVNSYETLFVIDPDLTEEETKGLVERFQKLISDNGGEITETNEWGKRKLAYAIRSQGKDKTEGYYVLINFKSESTLPSELERIFGITEGIMRSIVLRHEEKKAEKAEAAAESEKTEA